MSSATKTGRFLEGKIAIVTGASRGIGAAICQNLASKGCSLLMNFVSNSSAALVEELAKELTKNHGIRAVPVQADMGSAEGPQRIISAAKEAFETTELCIDIIVNNAGVSETLFVEECDPDNFAYMYNVNVRGPMLLMKAALPYLPHDRSGRVINVSSVASSLGLWGNTIYGGTKAALEAMTRTWSRELAERATVNAINPGPVDTEKWASIPAYLKKKAPQFNMITPLAGVRSGFDNPDVMQEAAEQGGRPAYTEEIAGLVGVLCNPDAGWSTGSVLCANGGMKFSF